MTISPDMISKRKNIVSITKDEIRSELKRYGGFSSLSEDEKTILVNYLTLNFIESKSVGDSSSFARRLLDEYGDFIFGKFSEIKSNLTNSD
jgi:hypothetical protein